MIFNQPGPTLIMIQGTQYGFYLEKKLGEGYGGSIYEGLRISDSSLIAVKILNPNSLIQNHIPLKQLVKLTSQVAQNKAKSLSQVSPLVEVLDVIQMDKKIIIMQLCRCNLLQFLQLKTFLRQKQIISIFKNIVQALLIVEKHGYHFSDLKPENILICKNGQVKLGDLQSLIILHGSNQSKPKFHNSIFGTLRYMPPQLIGLGQYSSKNYIWSLGVMLHQIIYGSPPFQVFTLPQNFNKQLKYQSVNSFYQSLFNLKICQSLSQQFPTCHLLLRKMLRFNAKNRLQLDEMYEIVSGQRGYVSEMKGGLQIPFVKIKRSSSQNTIDTNDGQTLELKQLHRKLQNSKLKSTDTNQTLKQNQCSQIIQKYFGQSLKLQKHQNQDFFIFLQETYHLETLKLMHSIEAPSILVKKLSELKIILTDLLKSQNITENKQANDCGERLKRVVEQIRQSKAFCHLQRTIRIKDLDMENERNFKQLALWIHLNEMIQVISTSQSR